jgi:hypothetical protein
MEDEKLKPAKNAVNNPNPNLPEGTPGGDWFEQLEENERKQNRTPLEGEPK